MKKVLLAILSLGLILLPIKSVKAEEKYYDEKNTLNLIEVLEEEKIELKNKDYKESDDQVTIYLFRGLGCDYCRAFLKFLNEISVEHGDKFKLVSFETWYNEENAMLMDEISTFLELPADGVPYIIIGEQVIPGYVEDYDEDIVSTILGEYEAKNNNNKNNDVFYKYEKELKAQARAEMFKKIWSVAQVFVYVGIIVLFVYFQNRSIKKELKEIKQELAKLNKKKKE